MKRVEKEKRKYQRYITEMQVYFRVTYDIRTRLKFQVLDTNKEKRTSRKYSGISENINIEGLCFVSKKKLEKGDMLLLEVYAPNVKVPIQMEGKVRWSQKLPQEAKRRDMFHTGVKLILVSGKSVADSIYYDAKYKVAWSLVLEAVFRSFKAMIERLKGNKKSVKMS